MTIARMTVLAGAVVVAGIGTAFAQQTVVISPDNQTVIHKYVVEHHVEPIQVPSDTTIAVGSTLPDTVELQTIDVPDLPHQYRYVVVDGQTLVVDPGTRQIVQVLQ